MSSLYKAIEDISQRGYVVNEEGEVTAPSGKWRKLYTHKKSGYKYFSVKFLKKVYTIPVAWLQAYQKFGNRYSEKGIEVRHLNGNPGDNSVGNIEIGTHSQNMLDIPTQVRAKVATNAASYRRKMSNDDVAKLRQERKDGATYQTLMKRYGIAKSTVSGIVNYKTYKI